MNRRQFLCAAGAGAIHAGCGRQREKSPVAILKAASYSAGLAGQLRRGAELLNLEAKGKRVLLKPNLVEFDSSTAINTHVSLIAAAVELFRHLGAAQIRIGEGPGHRRDTLYLAEEAGYRKEVERFDSLFVDLNRDDVSAAGPFGDTAQIYLPHAALEADLVVSLAKMKTHHWACATLSMKNYFGLVPGAVYGWPKNHLHQIGIDRSIAELHRLFPRSLAIVDGVVGMEGNGPIQGTPKAAGVVVMGADLVAVDATCCRIMGIDPRHLGYLKLSAGRGNLDADRIEQRGEPIGSVHTPFALLDQFKDYRLT
ncbi:MAG: DUF362 domain-containing protein [Candidatus Solibacter usitatus]|nr:DUF362 domain-containing protein [Candidatus Solibacter usitatus]